MGSPPEKHCIQQFNSFASKYQHYFLICHHNADPDAIGAAWAIHDFLKKKGKKSKIIAESYSSLSLKIIEELGEGLDFEEGRNLKFFEDSGIIIVDTGDFSQLGKLLEPVLSIMEKTPERIFVFDHHDTNSMIDENSSINGCVLKNYYSTCEIIGSIFLESDEISSLDVNTLTALLCGIVYDTQRFYRAKKQTFELVHNLVEKGANYERAIELLTTQIDYSEKLARLKALQRMVLKTNEGIIIAMSHVSSYESSAARAIVNNGADIAFVVSLRKDEIRASIRAKKDISKKIDFKKILERITSEFGGSAGGHIGAMGMNIPYDSPSKKLIPKIHKMFYQELLKELSSSVLNGEMRSE